MTSAPWYNITCHCHKTQTSSQSLFSRPFQIWLNVVVTLRWRQTSVTAAWNEMCCTCWEWHSDMIGVSNHVWKVTEESEWSARTFPRRHLWMTCFLNLLLSSLNLAVHTAVVIVAFEVCARLFVGYEGQKEEVVIKECGVYCRFTCTVCMLIWFYVENLNQTFLHPFLCSYWCVSSSILSAGRQAHVMSSGSLVLPHKHKSLGARWDFILGEMRCHLLCKGKITIVENMTAPSTAPGLLSRALDCSLKLNP